MEENIMNKIIDGWEIIPACSRTGIFMKENWMHNEGHAKLEQDILQDMLKLFIPGGYGYYFNEIHEHDKPEELEDLKFRDVYYTPLDFYYVSGEYNIIKTASTEDYTYYAISLHGCSFASALTEYVRVSKEH